MRLDADGDEIWLRFEGGDFSDGVVHAEEDYDGNIIQCGSTWSYSPFDNWDGFVRKLDPNGNVIWNRWFGTEVYFDDMRCVRAVNDDGYIAVGYLAGDIFVVRLGNAGQTRWSYSVDVPGNTPAYWIEPTRDRGFVVAADYGGGESECMMFKLDREGHLLWMWTSENYSEYQDYQIRCIREDRDGNLYGCGEYRTGLPGYWGDWFLAKFDATGHLIWSKYTAEISSQRAEELILLPDGGLLVAGWDNNTQTIDQWLIRTDAEGNVQWEWTGDEGELRTVCQLNDGRLVSAGFEYVTYSDTDLSMICFEPEIKITLTPAGSGLIPSGGGLLTYDGLIGHILTIPTTLDAWVTVTAPAGQVVPMQQIQITLQPFQWPLFTSVQVNVPGSAPAGQYTYEVHFGDIQTGGNMGLGAFTFVKQGQ